MNHQFKEADKIIEILYILFALFSFIVAPVYQTFQLAVLVNALLFISYYGSKYLLPNTRFYQYVGSLNMSLYTALLIYQMHGMLEMHFVAFIGSILLIYYKDWRLQLPLTLGVVVHHTSFAYAQYLGYKEVYFTVGDYMDLQTFTVHVFLAAVIFFLCGFWAYRFSVHDKELKKQTMSIENKMQMINRNIEFAKKISEGELESTFIVEDGDELGSALLTMQSNLKVAKQKDMEETFFNVGMAQLGEMLRKSYQSIEEQSFEVLKFLVKYIKANQGSIFVLNNDENSNVYLEAKAFYAYDRRKFISKKIELGEGLLGQAFLEKDILFLTEIPQDYVQITSGLGHANPNCVIIVPMLYNDEAHGVIELASFNVIKEYEIKFLRKAAENIASALAATKNNERMQKMLNELQLQSEAMRAQEEEMRQNMEELMATQEELTRKQKLSQSRERLESVDN